MYVHTIFLIANVLVYMFLDDYLCKDECTLMDVLYVQYYLRAYCLVLSFNVNGYSKQFL